MDIFQGHRKQNTRNRISLPADRQISYECTLQVASKRSFTVGCLPGTSLRGKPQTHNQQQQTPQLHNSYAYIVIMVHLSICRYVCMSACLYTYVCTYVCIWYYPAAQRKVSVHLCARRLGTAAPAQRTVLSIRLSKLRMGQVVTPLLLWLCVSMANAQVMSDKQNLQGFTDRKWGNNVWGNKYQYVPASLSAVLHAAPNHLELLKAVHQQFVCIL